MELADLRRKHHARICAEIIHVADGIPNFADRDNALSVSIARALLKRLHCERTQPKEISGQTAGSKFEVLTREFLRDAFTLIQHLRPGKWSFDITGDISRFQQYQHLDDLVNLLDQYPDIKAALGTDYLIKPDVLVARYPISDEEINRDGEIVAPGDKSVACHTPLRELNVAKGTQILHASISMKWTLRSDRAQNARAEALNLIRNRKGHTPIIAVVTAEPTPSRLASLALGTGDIDCVYHLALPELHEAIVDTGKDDARDLLDVMIQGSRLRDISDLPFDLAI